MNAWKTAALAGALVTAAGVVWGMAPVVHGQGKAKVYAAAPKKGDAQHLQAWRTGGRLGVSVRDVTEDDIKRHRLPGPAGVVVEDVTDESAAQKAGFKPGDVVTDFDGERVRSVRQFTRLVQETADGRSVTATVLRDGQRQTLTVAPREADGFSAFRNFETFRNFGDSFAYSIPRPPTPPRAPAPPRAPLLRDFDSLVFRSGTTLGVTVSSLSSQLADYFGAKEGVLVTAVTADSTAAKAGIKAGDVITSINGTAIDEPGDVRAALRDVQAGGEFTVDVIRDRKSMTLKGKTEERQTPRRRVVV